MSKAIKRRDVRPVPKQARAREKQTAILRAAEALVLAGDLENVTTTAIAVKASIPVGSIYRYFEDKDDILEQLYRQAYDDVEQIAVETQRKLDVGATFEMAIRPLLASFWRTARDHPTFVPLTRWANRHFSLWDVTPGPASSLTVLVEGLLQKTGIHLSRDRQDAIMKTLVTSTSVLIDQALEEDDETEARRLLDQLGVLLISYVKAVSLPQS